MGKRKSKRSHGTPTAPSSSVPADSIVPDASTSTEATALANADVATANCSQVTENTKWNGAADTPVDTNSIAAVQEQRVEMEVKVEQSGQLEPIDNNQPEPKKALTKDDACKVMNRTMFALIQAGVALVRIFKPLPSLAQVIEALEKDYSIAITRIEMNAFQLAFQESSGVFNSKACYEYICSKVFPVELAEYQLRKALMERATKLRGKCDINKMLSSLVSTENNIDLAAFKSILVEKLALELANWVIRCIYARILVVPYTTGGYSSPIVQGKVFIKALERFSKNSQFSSDSVEGALRKLLTESDLINKFRDIDSDGSGTISLEECTTYLRGQHLDFPEAVVQDFLKRFDRDGDGMLGMDEILSFVRPKAQFGIQVLTPFGMFYMPTEPTEMVEQLVQRIHKRMFWLQHNHMLGNAKKSKKMLISVDGFCIRKHFGALPFEFKKGDIVHNLLTNGELLVLMEKAHDGTPSFKSKEKYPVVRCPPLECPYTPPIPVREPPPPPVEVKPASATTPQVHQRTKKSKALDLPTQVASWGALDVKKWLIYELKLKTIAPKLSQVNGLDLLQLASNPKEFDRKLQQQYQIHSADVRRLLQKAVSRVVNNAKPSALASKDDGELQQESFQSQVDALADENEEPPIAIELSTIAKAEPVYIDNSPQQPTQVEQKLSPTPLAEKTPTISKLENYVGIDVIASEVQQDTEEEPQRPVEPMPPAFTSSSESEIEECDDDTDSFDDDLPLFDDELPKFTDIVANE